jgi:hypothetical protein
MNRAAKRERVPSAGVGRRGQARRGRVGGRLPIGGFRETRRIAAEIGTLRGPIASSQALAQDSEALASGDDGHDVPAAAASRADKHIDGEHLFQESRPERPHEQAGSEPATTSKRLFASLSSRDRYAVAESAHRKCRTSASTSVMVPAHRDRPFRAIVIAHSARS